MKAMELTGKAEATQTRRYTSSQAAAQGHTQQSLPTTFLPTPAPHVDQRRIRDFTTTSHLDISASNQVTSQQVATLSHGASLRQLPQWSRQTHINQMPRPHCTALVVMAC